MAKRKSIADIINQRNRIQQEYINRNMFQRTDQQNDNSRYKRAQRIADKYISNIQHTKSYQNATSTAKGSANASPEMRQYSQSTYMGLSNG